MENPIKYTVIKTTNFKTTAHTVGYQELTQAIGEMALSCNEEFKKLSEFEFSGAESITQDNDPRVIQKRYHRIVFARQ